MADLSRTALEHRIQKASAWLVAQDNEHSRELVEYIESLEEALYEEGLGERHVITREYDCCPRVIGTGHKFGCYKGGREVYNATQNDDGTFNLGERR